MVDTIPREDTEGYETLYIYRQALKALAGIEGLAAGPFSPLARLEDPAVAADAEGLIASLEALEGAWAWAVPALLDPHRAIALVMGDGNTSLVGQYLFPDADSYGPGFQVSVGDEAVSLTGPLSLNLLGAGLYGHLALDEVAEQEAYRIDLSAGHFWALMACLDAYRTAALRRRLLRAGGAPLGVGEAEVARAWTDGVSRVNPGWAVSLFSLLVPNSVPRDLPAGLPRLLLEMARKGLLLEAAGPQGAHYALSDDLSPLLWGLTTALNFGLATQRLAQPKAADITVLGGWRTSFSIWLADLSDMKGSGVSLVFCGPSLADTIIEGVLGDATLAPTWDDFAMDTPYGKDALVSSLRAVPAGARPAPQEAAASSRSFCISCGNPLEEGLAFCNKCGKPVGGAKPSRSFCTSCGNQLEEGLAFCNKCGKRV